MPLGAARVGRLGKAIEVPETVDGFAHWYDATELTGFSDGNSVGTWPDEEGNNDLSQGTGSQQPTYKTGIINGEPIVRFDGSDDFMDNTSVALSQPVDIFIVYQKRSTDTENSEYLFDGSDGTTDLNSFRSTAAATANHFMRNDGTGFDAGQGDSTDPRIVTARYDGSSSVARQDGSQTATGTVGTSDMTAFRLCESGDTGAPFDADVGEVLIYDAALSDSDRDDVESYLSDKWGITFA